MTISMRCQDKERLVAYLYDDQDADERSAVERHLAECLECAAELRDLQGVRQQLAAWNTPEADLGFRVVRDPDVRPARARWPVPIWAGLPVAAMLTLAVAAAIANVELRYGPDGFTVRTGWAREAAPEQAGPAMEAASAEAPAHRSTGDAADAAWRAALADTERRLRAEIGQTRAVAATPGPGASVAQAPPQNRDEFFRQMRTLIEESERRQQRELALRLADFAHDVEAQRRADLLQIEQNVGQIEGLRATQSDMMNYIVRVSEDR